MERWNAWKPWAWLCLACLVGAALWTQWQLVFFPFPLDTREGAMLFSARLLASGINPYRFELQPQAANVYGLFYPWLASLVWRLGFGGLEMLRGLNALCLGVASLLIYRAGRRLGSSAFLCLWISFLFYISQLFFVAPDAKPDSLGLLLFLAAILLPLEQGASWPSLALGGFLALLAFYTKAYFGLAGLYLGLGLYVQAGFKRSAGFLLAFFVALAVSALWLQAWAPAYFYATLLHHENISFYDLRWALFQLAEFFGILFPGLTVLMFWAAWAKRKGRWQALPAAQRSLALCALASLALFVAKLGGYPGAELSYLLQLFAPFYFLLLGSALESLGSWRPLGWALIVVSALSGSAFCLNRSLAQEPQAKIAWRQAEALIAQHHQTLASGDLSPLLIAQGLPPADTGQTEYFSTASQAGVLAPLFPRCGEVAQLSQRYEDAVRGAILNGRFDLVLTHPGYLYFPQALDVHYKQVGTLQLPFLQQRVNQDVSIYVLKKR